MRAAARLMLFYMAAFAFFLAAGMSVSVMRIWLEARQALSPDVRFALMGSLLRAMAETAPAAAYAGALLVLPSVYRREFGAAVGTGLMFLLVAGSLFSATYVSLRLSGPADEEGERFGTPALAGSIVELDRGALAFAGSGDSAAAVLAFSGQALRVVSAKEARELAVAARSAPPKPTGSSTAASISADLEATARRLSIAYRAGVLPLLAYASALAFLIASLGMLSGATRWPFADMALIALAFRGVMVLDGIAASGPVLRFAERGGYGIEGPFVGPLLLGGCGIAIAAVGSLIRLAQGRKASLG